MVDALLDTTVLVDMLRNHPPAIAWKNAQGQSAYGITPIVWMELIIGAQNKAVQRRAVEFLTQFGMIYLTQADMDWAMQQLMAYHLSDNVGMMDCLIAAPSYRLQLPLYTHNLKHFAPLLGPLAQKPY